MKMKNLILILSSILYVFTLNEGFAQFFSATKIYEKCSDAVVLITTPFGSHGTGFFINEYGYIVTNYHVVANMLPANITVWTKDGSRYDVISIDEVPEYEDLDIAILKINGTTRHYLSLKPDEATVGEEVVAIGHPNRDYWNQSKGIISKINLNDVFLLQHDVATDEGNSGGPLINAKGQVVGVVTGYKRMFDNYGNFKIQETGKLATKISWVKKVLVSRGIKYYVHPTVVEGMTEYERQFEELQKEKEMLNQDRENLRKEREALNAERSKFYNEKVEFEKAKLEAMNLIEKANTIRKEIDKEKSTIKKKLDEIIEREKKLEEKELRLREKELALRRMLPTRFAFELSINPNFLYSKNYNYRSAFLNGSLGLFYRFGFTWDHTNYNYVSDRIGIVFGNHKFFDVKAGNFLKEYYQDVSLAIEFDEVIRVGFGRNLPNQYDYFNNKVYNFAYVRMNLTNYPIVVGLNAAFYSNNELRLQNFVLGLHISLNLNFLRI